MRPGHGRGPLGDDLKENPDRWGKWNSSAKSQGAVKSSQWSTSFKNHERKYQTSVQVKGEQCFIKPLFSFCICT